MAGQSGVVADSNASDPAIGGVRILLAMAMIPLVLVMGFEKLTGSDWLAIESSKPIAG